ncbi:MAG TPA: DUF6778 family protein [Paenirhodobacter sp.]
MTTRTRMKDGFSRRKALRLSAFGLAVLVAGCGVTRNDWQVAYPDAVPAEQARSWHVTAVNVVTPQTLTTSDVNGWTPDYDIVWHGDEPGDRRAQVSALMTTAIRSATAELKGKTPVTISVTMQQFHAITPNVEKYANFTGVHDIKFTMQVVNARTRKPLTPPTLIEANAPALVGSKARNARAQGYTQKQEVIEDVAKVVKGYFSLGPDPRHGFSRLGR